VFPPIISQTVVVQLPAQALAILLLLQVMASASQLLAQPSVQHAPTRQQHAQPAQLDRFLLVQPVIQLAILLW